MGLDIVEMVMDVEERFQIEIPEADAEVALETAGTFHAYICGKLRDQRIVPCLSSMAFYRLRRGLMDALGVGRSEIRPDTRLEDMLPPQERRLKWEAVGHAADLELPALVRPVSMRALILLAGLVLWGAGAAGLGGAIQAGGLSLLLPVGLWLGGVSVWVLAYVATKPAADQFPTQCSDLRGLTIWVLKRNPGRFQANDRRWTDEEVWDTLRDIIVENLGVRPERVTRDARFDKDLGAW